MPRYDLDYQLFTTTLENGLQVIINHDPVAPSEALNIWYQVGSADEAPGATGFAHLFEHLMFSGSAHVKASEHLALLESIGGSANATTSFDRTNFFETIPPGALELALWLEADRMSSLAVNHENFSTQREVVKEEKRQRYDNVPYGDQLELLLELNFPKDHPYGHPTIGSMADLDAAGLESVQDFYHRWYRPNNAVLTLSGPVDPNDALGPITKYLGDLEPGEVTRDLSLSPTDADAPAGMAPLPDHQGLPEIRVRRDVPSSMVHLYWRTPPFADPRHLAVEQTMSVLASGQSSRLPNLLVRHLQIADAVGSGDFGLARGGSLASLSARIRSGHSADEVIDVMLSEIERLASDGPTPAELARVNAGLDRDWLSALASVDSRADEISGFASLTGDPNMVNTLLSSMHAVSASDIAQIAQTFLAPEKRAVLVYEAENQ